MALCAHQKKEADAHVGGGAASLCWITALFALICGGPSLVFANECDGSGFKKITSIGFHAEAKPSVFESATAYKEALFEAANQAVRKKRPYGIEIEFSGGRRDKIAKALAEKFDGSLSETYSPQTGKKDAFLIRTREFGELKLVAERDGYHELVSDHRVYKTPKEMARLLEILDEMGARGTFSGGDEANEIGIHVSVQVSKRHAQFLLRDWLQHESYWQSLAKPAPERYPYNRPLGNFQNLRELAKADMSPDEFNKAFLTSNNNRERELNLAQLLSGEKEVVEIRIFNTETPERLEEAIRLSLGFVERAAE